MRSIYKKLPTPTLLHKSQFLYFKQNVVSLTLNFSNFSSAGHFIILQLSPRPLAENHLLHYAHSILLLKGMGNKH